MDVPVPIVLAIIGTALFFVWQFYKKKVKRINDMPQIPKTLPRSGFEVPILVSFTGLKSQPRQTSKTYNNFNPSLILFEEHLKCRVISSQIINYIDIEKIDIWDTVGTRNLHVYVKNTESTFVANLLNRKNLSSILSFFKRKEVRLTSRAETYLKQNPT